MTRAGGPGDRPDGGRAPARLLGVDAARALALAGMFATHTLPLSQDGAPTVTALLADGRAAALFAVLAGVGVALSTGGPHRPRGAREGWAFATGLAVRGVLVGLIGLALVELGAPVLVILAFYGLLFLVAIPFLGLPPWALAAGAALACAGTPVVSHILRPGPEVVPPQAGIGALADPAGLLVHLSLTGFYPVLTWTTYLLTGMAIGRLDLRRASVAGCLLGGGVGLALVASALSAVLLAIGGSAVDPTRLADRFYGTAPTDTWWWLAVDAPHSGTPLDLAHTTGCALAVLGAMLLLARRWPAAVWVPAAVGSIPLTLYVLHAVALAAYPAAGDVRVAVLLAHLLGALVVAVGLRLVGRRGPLEYAVSTASRTARDGVRARAPASQ